MHLLGLCGIAYILGSGLSLAEAQESPKRRQSDETADARAKLLELCRTNKQDFDALIYKRIKSVRDLLPEADPPWPPEWATLQFRGEEGHESALAFPGAGLAHIDTGPAPEDVGETRGFTVFLDYDDFSVQYSVPTVAPKKGARSALARVAKEVNLAPSLVQRISGRIDELSGLQLYRQGIGLASGSGPSQKASLEELVYYNVVLEAYTPAVGTWCRETSHGKRTIMCFSGEDLINTPTSIMIGFDTGTPLYAVIARWNRRGPNGLPLAQSPRHREEFTSILRSVFHLALRVEERK